MDTFRNGSVFSEVASSSRVATNSKPSTKHTSAKASRNINPFSNPNQREAEIALALEEAERMEQARVRQWNCLLLRNPWHVNALTLQDEYSLPALEVPWENHCNLGEKEDVVIQPTPLVRPGLDRMYILSQLDPSWEVSSSKDLACTLTCELAPSLTAFVQEKNLREHRNRIEKSSAHHQH